PSGQRSAGDLLATGIAVAEAPSTAEAERRHSSTAPRSARAKPARATEKPTPPTALSRESKEMKYPRNSTEISPYRPPIAPSATLALRQGTDRCASRAGRAASRQSAAGPKKAR